MSVENHLVSPDILSAGMAIIVLAVGAAAITGGETAAAVAPARDNAEALKRLYGALTVDVSVPRYDLPVPQYTDNFKNHINQRSGAPKPWRGYALGA